MDLTSTFQDDSGHKCFCLTTNAILVFNSACLLLYLQLGFLCQFYPVFFYKTSSQNNVGNVHLGWRVTFTDFQWLQSLMTTKRSFCTLKCRDWKKKTMYKKNQSWNSELGPQKKSHGIITEHIQNLLYACWYQICLSFSLLKKKTTAQKQTTSEKTNNSKKKEKKLFKLDKMIYPISNIIFPSCPRNWNYCFPLV